MAKLRVLVSSDDPRVVEKVGRLLRRLGHTMLATGSDGAVSPEKAASCDALLFDARDGNFTAALAVPMCPTILVVTPTHQEAALRILEQGPFFVLVEPLRARALGIALDTACMRGRVFGRFAAQDSQLRWLQEAAHALASCETVEHVLSVAADHVQRGRGYDRIGIALVDEEAGLVRYWLSTDEQGRRYVRQGDAISLAPESPAWRFRVFRELLGEGRDFSYAEDTWAETPPDMRDRLDGRIKEGLVVSIRLGDRCLGWIAMDNLLSGRHLGPEEAPTLVAFAREVGAALARARARQAVERRAHEFAALMDVSLVVAAQRDPAAACRVAVDQLAERFGYAMVSAYLRQGDTLILQTQRGYSRCFETIELGQGICGRTALLATPELLTDVRLDPDYRAASEQVVAELCVPIMLDEQAVGVLNVESTVPGVLDMQAQELLVLLARQVAVAVEGANARAAEERRAGITDALARATAALAFSLDPEELQTRMLGLLHTVVPCDAATWLRIEDGMATPAYMAGNFYTIPDTLPCAFPVVDDPIFAEWVRDGRTEPELIPDTSLDPRWRLLGSRDEPYISRIRCYLGVPVLIDGRLVAALCLGNFTPASFDALAVTAAADFADRLARALRNARLYNMELQANARLQAVLRLQDDFVATVSHELRTPLTSILGFAENLTTFWPIMDEKRRLASIERIHNAGMRLDRLVRDLLQLAHTDPDAMRLTPRSLMLGGLITQAVGEIAAKYPDQAVLIDPAIERAVLWADPDRLIQVLVNLLDNAAKHSPLGQPIRLEWEQEDGWCTLSVCDSGRGIRPGDVRNLFRRFGKIDTVVRAGYVGTGLGLYICKQLAEAMSGTIWYEPGAAGIGSRFRVRLPLARQALTDLPSSTSAGRLSPL